MVVLRGAGYLPSGQSRGTRRNVWTAGFRPSVQPRRYLAQIPAIRTVIVLQSQLHEQMLKLSFALDLSRSIYRRRRLRCSLVDTVKEGAAIMRLLNWGAGAGGTHRI